MFQIKDITKLLGLDRSFLHYYDEIGIIVPKKNENNYRQYSENDLIAIASSKYYRAMEMPLKELSDVILESDHAEKTRIMNKQKEYLLNRAELFKDLAYMSDQALAIYDIAYQEKIQIIDGLNEFEFVPMVHNNKILDNIKDEKTIKLLGFFPFVSYSYYFPINSMIDESQFDYYLGLAIIPFFKEKYKYESPDNCTYHSTNKSVIMTITKDMNDDKLYYEDFEKARQYAKLNELELSGEAIGYCVFSNYEKENSKIKIIVYFFTK